MTDPNELEAPPIALADGRYLLVQQLGEGGMASVFRAFDQRLQVWRAIKILAPEYATKPRLRQRFESEAQTMALLEHPNIVRVYDVTTDGEFAFIVMELLEGGSLVDWIESHGPMPPAMAVDVTIQTCTGISAAHAKGVIHRDIKPHNVLVGRDGRCRVTDFGIAQVTTGDQSLTRTGAVMGTWGYMAPEQRTNAKAVDVRSDVYSTAASLYTLLTNQMPMDLFAADRDPSMLSGVDPIVAPVLVKATDYHRENRYSSMEELSDALREVRRRLPEPPPGTPALPRPPGIQHAVPRPDTALRLRGGTTDLSQLGRFLAAGGTISPDEAGLEPTNRPAHALGHAPTMAPDQGPELRSAGPEQHVPLYDPTPLPPRRSFGLGLAVLLGLGLGVVGIGAVGAAATGLWFASGDTVTPAADPTPTPDAPPVVPPPVDVPPTPPPSDTPAGTADPGVPTATNPADPKTKTDPKPKANPKEPKIPPTPGADPKVPDPKIDPGTAVVVAPPVEPPKPQCLKVSPPAAAAVNADAVFKASLCNEDGTEITLHFRPSGGPWQSRLMPKALGAHLAKVKVDETFAAGLDWYVSAGGLTEGSAGAPNRVSVQ